MATESFYTNLVIETEEQVQALLRAFEEADNRPPEPPMVPSIGELIERGNKLIEGGFFDHLL